MSSFTIIDPSIFTHAASLPHRSPHL
jgi:hypothetical protein